MANWDWVCGNYSHNREKVAKETERERADGERKRERKTELLWNADMTHNVTLPLLSCTLSQHDGERAGEMGMMRRKWKVMGSESAEGLCVCVCVCDCREGCLWGCVSHRLPFKECEPPAELDRWERENTEGVQAKGIIKKYVYIYIYIYIYTPIHINVLSTLLQLLFLIVIHLKIKIIAYFYVNVIKNPY